MYEMSELSYAENSILRFPLADTETFLRRQFKYCAYLFSSFDGDSWSQIASRYAPGPGCWDDERSLQPIKLSRLYQQLSFLVLRLATVSEVRFESFEQKYQCLFTANTVATQKHSSASINTNKAKTTTESITVVDTWYWSTNKMSPNTPCPQKNVHLIFLI